MWQILKTRLNQGYRTSDYPKGSVGRSPTNSGSGTSDQGITRGNAASRICREAASPYGSVEFPERFRGRLKISNKPCASGCSECAKACPTDAIQIVADAKPRIDLGKCLFCSECVKACPEKIITQTRDHRMATRSKADLILSDEEMSLAKALDEKTRKLFGRSLKLREVCAGSCGGCEAELTALNNVIFDLSRFGIQFVASPRHADGIIITGPVTENMRAALRLAYEAMPTPKIVIAVGACAISGGPFADSPVVHNGADSTIPVDLYIPGCPPHPLTILDGLLRLLGRLEEKSEVK
jgi:Ni,Fe-hydrogenase III small subunit/ferredoxin